MSKLTGSQDNFIFAPNKAGIRAVSQVLVTWLVVALLFVPIIVMRAVHSSIIQILCTMMSSGVFIMLLSIIMQASAAEVFVAGAT